MKKQEQELRALDMEMQMFLFKFEKELTYHQIAGYLIARGILILSNNFTKPQEKLAEETCRYANLALQILANTRALKDKVTKEP
jgi:hypothetical protein